MADYSKQQERPFEWSERRASASATRESDLVPEPSMCAKVVYVSPNFLIEGGIFRKAKPPTPVVRSEVNYEFPSFRGLSRSGV